MSTSLRTSILPAVVAAAVFAPGTAWTQSTTPALEHLARKGSAPAAATLTWVEDAKGKAALKVKPVGDNAVIRFDGIDLSGGEIEFDVLGQSAPPQSNFVGMAFRVLDQTTYDAVYLRPFNFRADDPARRSHAVQYISHPKYGWQVLRAEKPEQFEKPIVPPPDGDSWVHVRIVLEPPAVRVHVNGASEPSLVVQELSGRTGGGVGLWVGPGEGGHFANVRITPKKR